MQRLLATLLIVVFSFSLNASALASSMSKLPACCRKGGAHHCAMQGDSPNAGLTVKCPYMRAGTLALACERAVASSASWTGQYLPVVINRIAEAQAGYRISEARSRSERGPPFFQL